MSKILELANFSKKYGKKLAVDNISFSIEKGQIYGLLGPNGSGKTTTLSTILTLLKPTSGEIRLFGSSDLVGGLKKIGVLLESASYYPEMSAVQNMKISCRIKGINFSAIEPLLEKVKLLEDKNYKVKSFSLGMKQRLNVASALLTNPEFLIFDEPTNGLDPQGIAEMRNMIIELREEGKTILVASHLLNEMEKICSHIAILKRGKIVEQGELKEVIGDSESLEDCFLKVTK